MAACTARGPMAPRSPVFRARAFARYRPGRPTRCARRCAAGRRRALRAGAWNGHLSIPGLVPAHGGSLTAPSPGSRTCRWNPNPSGRRGRRQGVRTATDTRTRWPGTKGGSGTGPLADRRVVASPAILRCRGLPATPAGALQRFDLDDAPLDLSVTDSALNLGGIDLEGADLAAAKPTATAARAVSRSRRPGRAPRGRQPGKDEGQNRAGRPERRLGRQREVEADADPDADRQPQHPAFPLVGQPGRQPACHRCRQGGFAHSDAPIDCNRRRNVLHVRAIRSCHSSK